MANAHDITAQLWEMANHLRGKMEAPQYRDYILGFMFYRFLSEKQEHYLVESGAIEPEAGKTVNDCYLEEASGEELEDYLVDISDTLGYAIAPEYTWATIINKINGGTLKPEDFQGLFDDFQKNAQINHNAVQDFQGVFSDINLADSRLGNTPAAKTHALAQVAQMIDSFEYFDENGHDVVGDVYEYLISEFAGASVKKAGEFYTPHEVSQLMARIVANNLPADQEETRIYDFACGSGSLLLTQGHELPGTAVKRRVIHYFGQELSTTTYNLARMNLMMHGVDYNLITMRNADTLGADWPLEEDSEGVKHPQVFDAVVANPPYSAEWDNDEAKLKDARFKDYALAPKKKADYAFLLHGLYHLDNEGTMAIVLPHGVLFRGAKEGKIRQALLEKGQIEAIIGLPEKLFFSTGIPTIVMVLKKHRTSKDVLFIDASRGFEKGKNKNVLRKSDIEKIVETYRNRQDVDKYAHLADFDEIKENDYNLNIPRYVDTFEPEPPVDLKRVASEMKETDEKIKQTEGELVGMLKDLTSDDEEIMAGLNALIANLEGEAK